MYLSTPNCFKLDEIIKSFEVGYRSFVVEIVKSKFIDQISFLSEIERLITLTSPSSVINSHKHYNKLVNIKRNYADYYFTIDNCYNSYKTKTITENNVPYVSTIVDYVELFFNPHFKDSDLLKGFSPIEFINSSEIYYKLRNDLSHPASSRVSASTAKELFLFIKRVLLNLDGKYFWFVTKEYIKQKIDDLSNEVNENPIKINNLDEVAFLYQSKVLCRTSEISTLKQYLFGGLYRNAGSVVIYGYGGLGKTALVLEFIDELIKDCLDNDNKYKIDFILFFTSKEEALNYSQTTGNIQIKPLKKQISSFEEFQKKLFDILNISDIYSLEKFRGIIIIDNIETLAENGDRDKILAFIANSPTSIQYILTSREEEDCDKRISLKGFEINHRGEEFLSQYISENNLNVELRGKEEELLKSSKGNTLILVLSLLRLNDKLSTIAEIISELSSTSSSNIETVSLFMYRNTFDRVIEELNSSSTINMLTVISLYNEPIDLYSISKLSGINNMTEVERICDHLASKLVLNKIEDYYELNEFANKFVFIKLKQNTIEEKELSEKINEYRFKRRQQIRRLEEKKDTNPNLRVILEDWQARNSTDTLAIYDAFNLYNLSQRLIKSSDIIDRKNIMNEIDDRLDEDESMSSHPYIKFQKARIYQTILNQSLPEFKAQDLITSINSCYEDIILTINVDFRYIKNTKSYASVLWFYAQFIIKRFNNHKEALKYLDEAKRVFEYLDLRRSDEYKGTLRSLQSCYKELFKITRNNLYSIELKEVTIILQQIISN